MVDRSGREPLVSHGQGVQSPFAFSGPLFGTPGWIRTYNHMILNQAALPISVQGHYLKNFAESTFSTA